MPDERDRVAGGDLDRHAVEHPLAVAVTELDVVEDELALYVLRAELLRAERLLRLEVEDLAHAVRRDHGVLELDVGVREPGQGLEEVAEERVEEEELAHRELAPDHERAAEPEDADRAARGEEHGERVRAHAEHREPEGRADHLHEARLGALAHVVLGAGRLDRRVPGDDLDEVGLEVGALLHGLALLLPDRVAVGEDDEEEERDRGEREGGEAPVVDEHDAARDDDEEEVHDRGEDRPRDRLPDLVGVVEPGQDLARAARLEEVERQPEDVLVVLHGQRDVDLLGEVDEEVPLYDVEADPEDREEHDARAREVEEPEAPVEEDRVHEVLDVEARPEPERREEDRGDDALDEERPAPGEEADEAPVGGR